MAWSTSTRRAALPSNWSSLQPKILRRDPTCQLAYDCCVRVSTEVDHIDSATDHSPANLRGVCTPCHKRRTQAQAQAAKPQRKRTPEPHPGRLT